VSGEASTFWTAGRLPAGFNPLSDKDMTDDGLASSLDRAERALSRIERALDQLATRGRDEQLREKVRDVVAELDSLIMGAR
jgi:hypothetical protein